LLHNTRRHRWLFSLPRLRRPVPQHRPLPRRILLLRLADIRNQAREKKGSK
jgi:hypothetical protein